MIFELAVLLLLQGSSQEGQRWSIRVGGEMQNQRH